MLSFKYAITDLRGALQAFRVVLLCLVLGVGAISSVQFISRSVLESIARDGRIILGADMIVRHLNVPAPQDMREWLREQGGILSETIETRVMLANADTDENTLVELKAIDEGYPLYGVFETDRGNDLQALLPGGIVLDEALRERLGVEVGDDVRMGDARFKVLAFIVNEPDRAGGARFGIAPRAVMAHVDFARTGLLDTGSMVGYDLRARFADGADIVQLRQALEARYEGAQFRVTDADNASPRLTEFIERLMLFLTLVGFSALLIGGIGIGNGTRAYLDSRVNTIAILKAVGAPVKFIERMYVFQIAIIALIGTFIGVVIGVVAPFLVVPHLGELLPFSVEPRLDFLGVVVPVFLGLLIVFAFTLWPLGQAVAAPALRLFRGGMPLYERVMPAKRYRWGSVLLMAGLALLAVGFAQDTEFALWFVCGAGFCLLTFWLIGKMIALLAGKIGRGGAPVFKIALRNLSRVGNATAGTVVSLGLGLTVLISVTLIELNLREGIVRNLPEDAPSFFFLDIQGHQRAGFEDLLNEQPSVGKIVLSPNLRGRIVAVNGVPADEALVDENERWLLQNDRGFTYVSELPAHSEILSGEWWPDDYAGEPLVSVVEDVVRGFGAKVGDEITVNIMGRDIRAKIANTRSVNWMNFTVNYAITFAPGTLEAAPHGYLATVVADKAHENQIQKAVGAAYPNVTMIRLSEAVEAAGSILGNMAKAVRATALVAVVTGILVLAGSLAASRKQRLYDTVVLKVLGVRGRVLLRGFLFEFGLLGVVTGGVSLLFGAMISWVVMKYLMGLGWHFYGVQAVGIGFAGLVITVVMGWLVTGRVLSMPAAPYLRNG